jgi:hypothetical protein
MRQANDKYVLWFIGKLVHWLIDEGGDRRKQNNRLIISVEERVRTIKKENSK